MRTGEQNVQTISTIVLAVVVLVVLLGTIRLVLEHWTYVFLTAALAAFAVYLFKHRER